MKHNFKNLQIWIKSRALVKTIYALTTKLPGEEKFGLSLQIRRSVISISSNIAEGCGRGTDKQLAQFLDIAIGSSCELETQLYLASDLSFFNSVEVENLVIEVSRVRKMMISFKKTLDI
ncbi:MAG: four helix bundle protein [Saprospiraceae bacterium]|nr:four helix bundle protein [Saprospiraceae bacterium]